MVDVSGTGIPPPSSFGERRDRALPLGWLCRFESYRLHHFNIHIDTNEKSSIKP